MTMYSKYTVLYLYTVFYTNEKQKKKKIYVLCSIIPYSSAECAKLWTHAYLNKTENIMQLKHNRKIWFTVSLFPNVALTTCGFSSMVFQYCKNKTSLCMRVCVCVYIY